MKRFWYIILSIGTASLAFTAGTSYYMLRHALSPETGRADTARCFQRFAEHHPEANLWLDSLRSNKAFRDTFVVMPSGERHHAYYVHQAEGAPVALVLHGWRGCAIDFLQYGHMYHQKLECNILLPDLHAHGLSEGDAIGMGWKERHDVLHWMSVAADIFQTEAFIVHGISMGAATTMSVSGEPMPAFVKRIHFVEDCGYTSVWDELRSELKAQFGLPAFPLMYTASLLCRLLYGWDFCEASSLQQVAKCQWPMLFIHGDSDHFVPTWMVHPLYEAKPSPKHLWITPGTAHALSLSDHPEEYIQRLKAFIRQ